ncbi:Pentapeptide repeat family protein [Minicystis rosea]|nr:Pentapeptide repeat family protein [Minicystis rosea]
MPWPRWSRASAARDPPPIRYGSGGRSADLTKADLYQSIFHRARCERARFPAAELTYADFSHANVEGADFTGASLFRTRFHRTREDGAIFTNRAVALGDDASLAEAETWQERMKSKTG